MDDKVVRKQKYAVHLFQVNRPCFSQQRCLEIVAARAGYTTTTEVKKLLERKGKLW